MKRRFQPPRLLPRIGTPRDLYLKSWRWSWPLPLVAAVLLISEVLCDPRPHKALRYGIGALVIALYALIAPYMNVRKGREFQRELEALESMQKK